MFQFIHCSPDNAKYGAADSEGPEEGGGGEDVLHMEPGAGEGEGGERHQPGHQGGTLQHAAPPATASRPKGQKKASAGGQSPPQELEVKPA